MARFFGISPGQEKTAIGLRVRVQEDGERVYIAGKWLDLGEDHAVAWIENGQYLFERPDGKRLLLGEFPAWTVKAKKIGKKPVAIAIMFNVTQFHGGKVKVA